MRDDVLSDMVLLDYLSEADRNDILDATATVLVPEVTEFKAPHFVYATRREVADLLGSEDIIDRGGLTIETTLNYNGYQVSAEKWAQVVLRPRSPDRCGAGREVRQARRWAGSPSSRAATSATTRSSP